MAKSARKKTPAGSNSTPPPLVALKNGRVEFPEKKWELSRLPDTISELASFYQAAMGATEPWSAFPSAFNGLLGRLVQDSAASETELVKYIKKQLCPLPLEGSAPPMFLLHNATLLDAVKSLATRTNYGLVLENGESPRSLALWRWETTTDAGFTEDLARIRTERRQRRELAKETLLSLFGALTETERAELTTAAASVGREQKKRLKSILHDIKQEGEGDQNAVREAKTKELQVQKAARLAEKIAEKEARAAKLAEKEAKAAELKAEREAKAAEKEAKAAELKAERDAKAAEKEAKRAEKETKRLAKEAEELVKKKKEMAGQKSISGFFSALKKPEKAKVMTIQEVVVVEHQDYNETFPGFYLRENVALALKPVCKSMPDDLWVTDATSFEILQDEFRRFCRQASSVNSSLNTLSENVDIVVVNSPPKLRFKLLRFAEDIRPPYFGSWSKKSTRINGRRPLVLDPSHLDYDYDSEAEWEEDEPGEELRSEDDIDDDEDGGIINDDMDDADGWVVPHGYLSDDEGLEGDHINHHEKGSMTKDQPKRRALEPLVPVVVGVFLRQKESPQTGAGVLLASPVTLLGGRLTADPMETFELSTGERDAAEDQRKSVRKSVFPEELSHALMLDINGKSTGIPKLVEDFKVSHPQLTKTAIEAKIKEIAVKEKRGSDSKSLWYPRAASVVL